MSALLCGCGFYRIVFQSFGEIDIKDAVQASCEVCTAMLGFIIVGWEAEGHLSSPKKKRRAAVCFCSMPLA